ncbi:hypothetical protein SBA6_1300001 [Candidatus Sulfopaludibacter sp. SbA6]|nr:hypothetical protein SBA6_1300001 [Candidatus Sulfopaludibacter sp. SbA6]
MPSSGAWVSARAFAPNSTIAPTGTCLSSRDGKLFGPPLNPPYRDSLRGYARGVEFFLQRSSANRFTGWISYAYGHTGMRDGGEPAGSNNRFPSDFDQRHTVNLYGGYRLKPTVNLSVRWNYGSGFPIPGFLQRIGSLYTAAHN